MGGESPFATAVWSERLLLVAASEAVASEYRVISHPHLLIALSRFADTADVVDDSELQAMLAKSFESLGIEPKRFRRRLRGLIGKGGATDASMALNKALAEESPPSLARGSGCSASARAAIARAMSGDGDPEKASLCHLLYALLIGKVANTLEPMDSNVHENNNERKNAENDDGIPDRL